MTVVLWISHTLIGQVLRGFLCSFFLFLNAYFYIFVALQCRLFMYTVLRCLWRNKTIKLALEKLYFLLTLLLFVTGICNSRCNFVNRPHYSK